MNIEWKTIETAPDAIMLLFWCPEAHQGIGSIECMMKVNDSYWTNGGPNAGGDMWFEEGHEPTHWAYQPEGPNGESYHVR